MHIDSMMSDAPSPRPNPGPTTVRKQSMPYDARLLYNVVLRNPTKHRTGAGNFQTVPKLLRALHLLIETPVSTQFYLSWKMHNNQPFFQNFSK